MEENNLNFLAMNTLDSVPEPSAAAQRIAGLVKEHGRVTGYRLSDSSIVSREEGVALAKDGQIRGVGIAHNKDTVYLKSLPDESESNNLSSLPTVRTAPTDRQN